MQHIEAKLVQRRLRQRAVRQVLTDIGYHGYITIEQERDPRNSGTSLRDVTESLNYLQGAGF